MDDKVGVIIVIAFVGVPVIILIVVVAIVVKALRRQGDLRRYEQWAVLNGWVWTRRPRDGWAAPLRPSYVLSGLLDGRRVSVAQYSEEQGESSVSMIAVLVELRYPFPATTVAPRGPISRMARKVLGPEETATGIPDFDRQFRITTMPRGSIPRWIGPELIAAHLEGRIPVSWSVDGMYLTANRQGRLPAWEAPRQAAMLLPLADLLEGSLR